MTLEEFNATKFHKGMTVTFTAPKLVVDDNRNENRTGEVKKVYFNEEKEPYGGGVCINDKYGSLFIHFSRIISLS